MSRISAVNTEGAQGEEKELFDRVNRKLGRIPNIHKLMGNSPVVLKAYMELSDQLAHTSLPIKLREQIALAVGQINGCLYCLAAHAAIGSKAGLSPEEIGDARLGRAADPKVEAILKFARTAVENRGWASDEDIKALKAHSVSEREIVEIIFAISVNMFTNYFNHIADPEIDFPAVAALK